MSKNNVLIVGASSSIGCEIIRQISGGKTVVLAHYHSRKDRLDAIQVEVHEQIVPIQADLSSEHGVQFLIESVSANCDFPQQIVFLAAPPLILTRFRDLTWDDFRRHIDIQLYASFTILHKFLPKMSLARNGKVVFVLSSCTLDVPPSAIANYVTAKYAVLGLMKSLATEYAGKQICINAVSPSMVETGFLSLIPEKIVQLTAQQHPLKRNARPADVAPVVKFLLSGGADYLTGVNIPVTGGA